MTVPTASQVAAPPLLVGGGTSIPWSSYPRWGAVAARTPHRKPAWDMETLKALIRYAVAGSGDVKWAVETCTFRPREQAFTTLINLCGRLRDWRKAKEVFQAMQGLKGVRPNTYTYSALISACSSAGEWEEAVCVFSSMKNAAASDPGCRPNHVTYSALITACERGGKFEKAIHLYDEMLENNIQPDKITFISALSACEKCEHWERAESILEGMHAQGLPGTSGVYVELLNHYAKKSDWSKALDLFLTMQMQGHCVDEHACRALMGALEAGCQQRMVLHLLEAMKDARIVIDLEIYNSALRTLAHAGWYQPALDVLDEIYQAQMRPDLQTAEAVIHSHIVAGRVLDAVQLASDFHRNGLKVTEKCLSTLSMFQGSGCA